MATRSEECRDARRNLYLRRTGGSGARLAPERRGGHTGVTPILSRGLPKVPLTAPDVSGCGMAPFRRLRVGGKDRADPRCQLSAVGHRGGHAPLSAVRLAVPSLAAAELREVSA